METVKWNNPLDSNPSHGVLEPLNDEGRQRLYASYANHCAIQKVVPLTYRSWIRASMPYDPSKEITR